LAKSFYHYLIEIGTSENYQNQNLKQIIGFAKSLGTEKTFYDIKWTDEIISFLDTKIKYRNTYPKDGKRNVNTNCLMFSID
jgi:hypothetical protein